MTPPNNKLKKEATKENERRMITTECSLPDPVTYRYISEKTTGIPFQDVDISEILPKKMIWCLRSVYRVN